MASIPCPRDALSAARAAAEALRLAPVGEAEVLARLEELAASIPDVEGVAADPVRMTPAERREIAWRALEQNRRR